ncbi:transmembrane protein, putative (macronuclear) [Tetrahymena thermophila SB210]|uniref:Transmembrane protein, putative n=1 Tax=Tetrahymena thermophila (strain SB210) TaxID=312017 RepID=Q22DT0_TETTS|nr:transmembrane protein, putative [Tetrahymena thermophila SB210]EAR83475.2 transmembrane protein, putative [Tetrahymena thermophila SB210]|eukprot:XP_001031138.2 transmembrane protein, putative [Tetrahymena thermophila SB210]
MNNNKDQQKYFGLILLFQVLVFLLACQRNSIFISKMQRISLKNMYCKGIRIIQMLLLTQKSSFQLYRFKLPQKQTNKWGYQIEIQLLIFLMKVQYLGKIKHLNAILQINLYLTFYFQVILDLQIIVKLKKSAAKINNAQIVLIIFFFNTIKIEILQNLMDYLVILKPKRMGKPRTRIEAFYHKIQSLITFCLFLCRKSIQQLCLSQCYLWSQKQGRLINWIIYFVIYFNFPKQFFHFKISSKILSNKYVNNTSYGGPFYCMKINGQYPEFKYTSIDQFDGFQYKNQAGQVCGNESNPCSCSYFNVKRMYPLDWRCRPWYQSANNTYYISYSQPYTDILLGLVSITCTFKVVIPRQQIHSIEDELNFQSDTILAIDINLGELQKRFMKNDTQTEYSYLLSTNTDSTVSDFSPFVIAHPLMNKFTEQSIYDVEFQQNDLSELEEYKNQTKFLVELQKNQNGCGQIFKNNDSKTLVIKKNNTQYITMFSTIQICFGNIYEQKTTAIAYYAIAISFNKRDQDIESVEQTMKQMLNITIQLSVGLFFTILLLFYFLLKNFLFINFENPIQILSNFVNKADSYSIYHFNQKIQNGELKTQYELKNFIYAINQVVLNVIQVIQQKLENNDSTYSDIILAYEDQLKVYTIFSHKYGIGMLLNNMAVMYLLLKNYEQALYFMNESEKISCSIFEQFTQSITKTLDVDQIKIISSVCEQGQNIPLLEIYACRKFQLANITYNFCKFISKKKNQIKTKNQLLTLTQNKEQISFLNITEEIKNYENDSHITFVNLNETQNNMKYSFNQTFYSQKFQQIQNKLSPKKNKKGGDEKQVIDIKMYLRQAQDLLSDSHQIFLLISDSHKINIQEKQKYSFYSIIANILLIKCILLKQGRKTIINQLFIHIRQELLKPQHVFNEQNAILKDILIQHYFYYKALFNYQQKKYDRALLLILKSLNKQLRNKIFQYKHNQELKVYDGYIAKKALKLLKKLIEQLKIIMDPIQYNLLCQDELNLNKIDKQQYEFNFFEMFFDTNQNLK